MRLVNLNIPNCPSITPYRLNIPYAPQSAHGISLAVNGQITISFLCDQTQSGSACSFWVNTAQTTNIQGGVLPGIIAGCVGGPRVVSSDCFA